MPKIQYPGTYQCEIIDAYPAFIGENETPALKICFETQPDDSGHPGGEHAYGQLWFSAKARERSMEKLAAAGVESVDDYKQLIGKPCSITCEEETGGDGKEYVNVAWINFDGESRGDHHGEVSLDAFKAKLGLPTSGGGDEPGGNEAAADEDNLPF